MSTELTNLLLREYHKILETGEFYDIEIVVGEEPNTKTFHLHSFVLKICSPYFRTALSSNWIKTENNIIKFKKPNINVEVFEILIKYIYSGKLELENNDVKTNVAVLIAADELCLSDLCTFIENFLLRNEELLKQNFVLIQDIANRFTQFTELSQFFNNAFQQNPSLIFKANDFITIKREILLEIVTRNNLPLNPIEIWDKLMEWSIAQSDNELPSDITRWTDHNVSTFKISIQPFIPHINFQGISRVDFFQKIKPFKNIFDHNFYIKILEYYCFNNIHADLENSLHPPTTNIWPQINRPSTNPPIFNRPPTVRIIPFGTPPNPSPANFIPNFRHSRRPRINRF
ncbi:BTB/POZ protein [Glomus cerebriforme]|uniref:BTB/POZ protein n=1 Tax=Glomus cerebriforme TaxID=658196 RepID=A0A397T3X0_9GLOM|nr:BTB/POZ protein [Glomus cerebriforme]